MSQQPEPFKAFTEEEKAEFEACIDRIKVREDIDKSIFPYPNLAISSMFYLWQQATREAKA